VLDLIRQAVSAGKPYVYLGYWIEECRKMSYKTQYRPIEGLTETGWATLHTDRAQDDVHQRSIDL
jgi:leucyl-tRNA---protein transferase